MARSVNNRTASLRTAGLVDGRTGPGGGSEGTMSSCSPSTPSVCRLVTITRRWGAASRRALVRTATACRRCSQLSNTISVRRSRRYSVSAPIGRPSGLGRSPNMADAALVIASPASKAATSISQVPAGNERWSVWASCTARRDLPMPAGPVMVSSLLLATSCRASASSCRRPMKLVVCAGRFPCPVRTAVLPVLWFGVRGRRISLAAANRAGPARRSTGEWRSSASHASSPSEG